MTDIAKLFDHVPYGEHSRVHFARGWRGIPGWLSAEEGAVLYASVRSTKGAIVELGTWCGRSLICLADARESLHGDSSARPIYSFDLYPPASQAFTASLGGMQIDPEQAKLIAKAVVTQLVLHDVEQLYVDAIEAASQYQGPKIGVLYIDDDHSGERVLAELEAWSPHFADQCEVCLHDFFYEPYGIEKAVSQWVHDRPEWSFVESQGGMARFRRERVFKVRARTPSSHYCGRAPRVWSANLAAAQPVSLAAQQCQFLGNYSRLFDKPPLKVSVLYPTWRLGGFDCLRAGLERQTMIPAEFEVVIIDALYPYRAEAVARFFADAPYRVVHAAPRDNVFPLDAGNRARNSAIAHARGEVLVWFCDYTIAEPLCLERHHAAVARGAGRCVSCGTTIYGQVMPGALRPELLAELPMDTIDDYVCFIESLPSDSPLWTSVFVEGPRELGRRLDIRVQNGHAISPWTRAIEIADNSHPFAGQDSKLCLMNGPIAPVNFFAKNEATSRAAMEAIGGWDEDFDGGHCYEDTDISTRLNAAGVSFILDKGNEAFCPNMRPWFPLLRRERSPHSNYGLFVAKSLRLEAERAAAAEAPAPVAPAEVTA